MKPIKEDIPLFRKASLGFIIDIFPKLREQCFPGLELIVGRGDIGYEMFFIQKGVAHVLTANNTDVMLTLESGDFFGEGCLLGKRGKEARHIVSVRAGPAAVYMLALHRNALHEVMYGANGEV